MPSVKLGPHFFKNELREYANWHFAYVREALQNSIDAKGSNFVNISIAESDGATTISWENNGEPMTERVLVDKLLALGESGKNFDSTVGGFGKAKTLLYYAHSSYSIRTGTLLVEGVGGEYDLHTNMEKLNGTRSTVVIDGLHADKLLQAVRKFATYAQWKGTLKINGDYVETNLRKGSPRRDLGFGVVYTNKSTSYRIVARVNGIPMFVQPCQLDRCVVIELTGRSCDVLTSNRDGLRYPYSNELSSFITEVAVDKRSALKNRRRVPRYIEFRGDRLSHRSAINVADLVDAPTPELVPDTRIPNIFDDSPEPVEGGGQVAGPDVGGDEEIHEPVTHESGRKGVPGKAPSYSHPTHAEPDQYRSSLGTNFVLKNETDLQVPAYYNPGSGEFSSYSHKLVRIWGRILLEMHRLFDHEDSFSVGFLFEEGGDSQTEAEHEKSDRYGRVYYLSPCKVVEQRTTFSKSFKKRFKLTERDRLIAIGAHEFVHGLGYSMHDQDYANKLTEVMAIVLKNRKKFNWCFK